MSWEVVIGLEVHAQLTTQSKIFSGASIAFGNEANTQASLVDLAMPGALPVLNKMAVEKAILFGLATNARIANRSVFERKNYFYPDLPKGYQISQLVAPIVEHGYLDIALENGENKRIGLTRAHLEEDAGKSLHEDFHGLTGIDLNRAGTPLLEIVSEPELSSAKEAVAYLRKLHQLVMWIGVCDGNMQEGSFRCDANVSVRRPGEPLGTRTEIKNINSFKFVEQAINYEIDRQIDLLESGKTITQETRLYDPDKDETRSMRSKEEANDYRYFPDPDLLPVIVDENWIDTMRSKMPELPEARKKRYIEKFALSDYDAQFLTQSLAMSEYFDALIEQKVDAKLAANWLAGELAAKLNRLELSIEQSPVTAERLAGLLQRISDQTISNKLAKDVLEYMFDSEKTADEIIDEKGMRQVTDTVAIEAWVDEVLAKNTKQVQAYKEGQTKMLGFFVGQIMKLSGGKANPAVINQLIAERLK